MLVKKSGIIQRPICVVMFVFTNCIFLVYVFLMYMHAGMLCSFGKMFSLFLFPEVTFEKFDGIF